MAIALVAAMNKANFLRVLALQHEQPDMEILKESLKTYYLAITASNRMRKDMLSRCITSITEIYNYFEHGNDATMKLTQIFGKGSVLGGMSAANISFLVDVSPSMNAKNRIGQATDTLLHIFDTKMHHGDYMYLAAFSNKFYEIIEPTTIDIKDDKNHVDMRDTIETLRYRATSGTTHFYRSLMLVADRIPEARLGFENWVIALTDGADNGKIHISKPIEYYKDKNIKLIVIAIDLDQDRDRGTLENLKDLVTEEKYFLTTQDGSIEKILNKSFDLARGDIVMETL